MILSLVPYASAQKIFREYNFRTGAIAAEIGGLLWNVPVCGDRWWGVLRVRATGIMTGCILNM
ncbi:hypothetical protein TH19_02040 [Thalassospira profundimaris]|uniref:Uncharacterized protein n=1 Tax=Thalassospira profundimaris TaxID=502049 RepID=A0A367WEP4_9PROT|nr:hypothetical protein TH19_02040 [Thalassospira profundimaris]